MSIHFRWAFFLDDLKLRFNENDIFDGGTKRKLQKEWKEIIKRKKEKKGK